MRTTRKLSNGGSDTKPKLRTTAILVTIAGGLLGSLARGQSTASTTLQFSGEVTSGEVQVDYDSVQQKSFAYVKRATDKSHQFMFLGGSTPHLYGWGANLSFSMGPDGITLRDSHDNMIGSAPLTDVANYARLASQALDDPTVHGPWIAFVNDLLAQAEKLRTSGVPIELPAETTAPVPDSIIGKLKCLYACGQAYRTCQIRADAAELRCLAQAWCRGKDSQACIDYCTGQHARETAICALEFAACGLKCSLK